MVAGGRGQLFHRAVYGGDQTGPNPTDQAKSGSKRSFVRPPIYNSPVDDRETIRRIKEEVASGRIPRTFKPADVNKALKIDWAGVFLPKHREGNPGGETELFVRVNRGTNQLR
jgi:hypothetical protein